MYHFYIFFGWGLLQSGSKPLPPAPENPRLRPRPRGRRDAPRARTALFLLSLSSNRKLTANRPSSSFHYLKSSHQAHLLASGMACWDAASSRAHVSFNWQQTLSNSHGLIPCLEPSTCPLSTRLLSRTAAPHINGTGTSPYTCHHSTSSRVCIFCKSVHIFSLHMPARESRLAFWWCVWLFLYTLMLRV